MPDYELRQTCLRLSHSLHVPRTRNIQVYPFVHSSKVGRLSWFKWISFSLTGLVACSIHPRMTHNHRNVSRETFPLKDTIYCQSIAAHFQYAALGHNPE